MRGHMGGRERFPLLLAVQLGEPRGSLLREPVHRCPTKSLVVEAFKRGDGLSEIRGQVVVRLDDGRHDVQDLGFQASPRFLRPLPEQVVEGDRQVEGDGLTPHSLTLAQHASASRRSPILPILPGKGCAAGHQALDSSAGDLARFSRSRSLSGGEQWLKRASLPRSS